MDLRIVADNFKKELELSKSGKKTSLPFIRHRISPKPIIKDGETFQILVIGGTIFRKALVKKDGKNIVIVEKGEKYQPSFKNKNDFDKFVEKEISSKVTNVALNFAYPLKPVFKNGKLDGLLISGTKENVFYDLVGKEVGVEVEKMMLKTHRQKIKVTVANDTICILMAGLTRFSWKEIAGGVIGTGTNFAFFLSENEVVNLESGNFDKFPRTPEAQIIDSYSTNKGRGTFEKEVAGAYLYKHFNLINEAKALITPALRSTQELDQIAQQNSSSEAAIAKSLLSNSASLVAAQIAGILEFKRTDLVFVIEGSLFWLSNGYRAQVKKALAEICPKYKAKFVKIPDSTILGAAKLIA